MIYVIRVNTADAEKAIAVLKAASRAAEKAGLPKPIGTFETGLLPPGPPPPPCGPGEC